MKNRTRIDELPILLKALVGDGEGWGELYVKRMIGHRATFITRLHQRYTALRTARERAELLLGSKS